MQPCPADAMSAAQMSKERRERKDALRQKRASAPGAGTHNCKSGGSCVIHLENAKHCSRQAAVCVSAVARRTGRVEGR